MILAVVLTLAQAFSVSVTVDANSGRRPISTNIYGRNNALSSWTGPSPSVDWTRVREAGIRVFRDNGGNNSTKYNWRLRLSSHPDWYNNVYTNDWDQRARLLRDNMPGAQAVFAFQLIGKAAKTAAHNFNDWGYNGSQWWSGVNNNWAGGGGPNAGDGNPDLYLMEWPADSTVGILDHWFGHGGLGLDRGMFRYWNMDNEPEIWVGTHDDVMPTQISAEEFMQRYFEVAKKARAKFPDIKLVGPVPANEWQWYNWPGGITSGGRRYPWLEYFIKRVGEEQAATGIRLLDVLDVHFYPYETNPVDVVQLHRVWFDRTYVYPGANGVKTINGGWDNNITREYVFERCREWLDRYLGDGHGVTFGVTETAVNVNDPNLIAVWYASTLGVFADEGVELFTPWDWKTGMWEVVHLFSRYTQETRVQATSTNASLVSAHASVNASADSLTLILINRSLTQVADLSVDLAGFALRDGTYRTLTLDNLPSTETFASHAVNAAKEGSTVVEAGNVQLQLPTLSVTALLLTNFDSTTIGRDDLPQAAMSLETHPNPFTSRATVVYKLAAAGAVRIELFDLHGRRMHLAEREAGAAGPHTYELDATNLASGAYVLRVSSGTHSSSRVVTVVR